MKATYSEKIEILTDCDLKHFPRKRIEQILTDCIKIENYEACIGIKKALDKQEIEDDQN